MLGVFVIATLFPIAELYLAVGVVFALFFCFSYPDQRIPVGIIENLPLLFFLYGFLLAMLVIIANPFAAGDDISALFYRARKHFIDFFVAYMFYLYFRGRPIDELFRVLLLGFLLNSFVGLVQFAMSPFSRVSMLFPEPSAAGYFWAAFILLLFGYYQKKIILKYVIFFIGFLVSSKAQILTYLAYPVIRFFGGRKNNSKLVVALLIFCVSTYFIYGRIHVYLYDSSDQYRSVVLLVQAVYSLGLSGLSIEHGVYGTFVTRLSSIYLSFISLVEHPLGVGFGFFSVDFGRLYGEHLYMGSVGGGELEAVLRGEKFASSKSNFMEIIVSTGLVGVGLIAMFIVKLGRIARSTGGEYIYYSFLLFLVVSFLAELVNFYLYFYIYIILFERMDKLKSLVVGCASNE